ncbi:hypothetical protein EYF80_045561 [Liparis tanakae]|uniref:Uncharacterized protein n=1 Tax=Liparis tanakae TaxID=230148 RepID=A0A4Z2FTY1_9TELE|nr:hypothetical protein EYF80_045561 [Liparis tanakae]
MKPVTAFRMMRDAMCCPNSLASRSAWRPERVHSNTAAKPKPKPNNVVVTGSKLCTSTPADSNTCSNKYTRVAFIVDVG